MSRRLPVPIRAVAGPLARAWERVDGGAGPERVVRVAREAGLHPLAVYDCPGGPALPDDAPAWVLVHEAAPPAARAAFHGAARSLAALPVSVREWEVWSEGVVGRRVAGRAAAWGEALPVTDEDDVEARRRLLRHAAELLWWQLPRGLARGADDGADERAAAALRSLCERLAHPARFPPIPAEGSEPDAVFAASFGVAHATFSAEVAPDHGPALTPGSTADAPPPHASSLDALERVLRADVPGHLAHELLALYVLPGPWGTLHANQLVAVVADEAPLHRAAALRRRLGAHLGLVPRDLVAGAFLGGQEPLVVSLSTLHGQLRRRLWRRPLRRLALRLESRLVLGEDVLAAGLEGTDFVRTDLRCEVAALITRTGAVFRSGTAAAARDLLFGAWPRVIALAAGRSPLEPRGVVHADLAARTDRALARVGSAARTQPWGDPASVDRGRAAPLLREWGPALIRLQEVALEVLG